MVGIMFVRKVTNNIQKIGILSDKYQEEWKSRFILHDFSIRNSGPSSGDVRKKKCTADKMGNNVEWFLLAY